jgi:hypothetical protein
MVCQRALEPASKLEATRWVGRDVVIDGVDGVGDDQLYRAMDFPLNCQDRVREAVFFSVGSQLSLDVDAIFFDRTTTYREAEADEDGDGAERYIVCHNPAEAERDRARRQAQIDRIEFELSRLKRQGEHAKSKTEREAHLRGECALRDHKTHSRDLRQLKSGRLALDRERTRAEERLDGRVPLGRDLASDPRGDWQLENPGTRLVQMADCGAGYLGLTGACGQVSRRAFVHHGRGRGW